jgi:uncharacterized membrane protein
MVKRAPRRTWDSTDEGHSTRRFEALSTLVAIAYPDENRAEQVMEELKQLQSEYLVDLESAVYVTKDAEGKVKVHGVDRLTGPEAAWGAFWGLLFGILFFVPVAGVLFGAGLGALFGHFTKIGLDEDFVKGLSDKLGPNSSAIFMLVRKATPDKVVPELSKFGGTVLTSNLPDDADKKLQEALDAANAAQKA